MPTKQRRYPLKMKESKQILDEASDVLKVNLESIFGEKTSVEVIESDVGKIYLIGGKPLLLKINSRLLPTLMFSEFNSKAPKIIVDMGAIPYVCKGATVMAPGIVRIEGDFRKGDLLLVSDVKYNKFLAVGETLLDSETARNTKKGPVVKTLHYVSDKVWDFIKTLDT
jgi:PUA-domain protein